MRSDKKPAELMVPIYTEPIEELRYFTSVYDICTLKLFVEQCIFETVNIQTANYILRQMLID